ncbi:MAG: sugar phosphate isomerase/epimerase family protein [Tunicatimonas sp.]
MSFQHQNSWSRRNFLGALAAGGVALPQPTFANRPSRVAEKAVSLHVFSKHLQFLDYEATARAAAEIGFDGVDLAVRPKGHVLPENVTTDLPRAVAALKQAGLQALLMTTAIMDPAAATAATVLETAHQQGITHYRTNWLRYDQENVNLPESLKGYRKQLTTLAELNRKTNMIGGYQNHSGEHYVGAPVWDIATLLNEINSPHLGSQYDIRHATAEGGQAWPLGLDLIHPRINSLVIKDFRWEKGGDQWKIVNVPLGEGMVDFSKFFSLLKKYDVRCPISVHFEYELPGEKEEMDVAERTEKTIAVMRKDVTALQKYLDEAGLG